MIKREQQKRDKDVVLRVSTVNTHINGGMQGGREAVLPGHTGDLHNAQTRGRPGCYRGAPCKWQQLRRLGCSKGGTSQYATLNQNLNAVTSYVGVLCAPTTPTNQRLPPRCFGHGDAVQCGSAELP